MAARGKKQRRQERRTSAAEPVHAAPVAASAASTTRPRLPAPLALLLAAAGILALCAWMRLEAPAPWSYDEYYHLGLARELRADWHMHTFWWTPFSTLFDRFVDSTPIFHLLLAPLATLPLERASALGVLAGQLFVVAAFAWALWSLRVPRAWWFLLALPATGTLFLQRLEMLRPHAWLIGFTVLVVALLVERRRVALAVACAVFGLTHTGGWIAIAFAVLWAVAGIVARDDEEPGVAAAAGAVLPERRTAATAASGRLLLDRVRWQPVVAAAGGWLVGQLAHPQLPDNFRLFLIANFLVPFQASGAGDAALQSQLGTELFPPEAWIVAGRWPTYVAAALLVGALVRWPALRTRATITAALPALAFLLVGTFRIRRFLELGEPLVLLALAMVAREWVRGGVRPPPAWARRVLAAITAVALFATVQGVRAQGYGRHSGPLAMARWLGEHGQPGERVFTAQWADSAPLFYAAPQLQSLFALDPTVFYTKDPKLFERYVAVVQGRDREPARTIRETFGARWVTLWRMPAYQQLALQLWQGGGAKEAYSDADYLVLDLGPGKVHPRSTPSGR
jgi:hypothetical protein